MLNRGKLFKSFLVAVALVVFSWGGFHFLSSRNKKTWQAGPFTVEYKYKKGMGWNTSGAEWIEVSARYQGSEFELLNQKSNQLRYAYVVSQNPPALLVAKDFGGSIDRVFLVKHQNDSLSVEPIAFMKDYRNLSWIKDDKSTSIESPEADEAKLTNGSMLFVQGQALLDLKDLRAYPLNLNFENLNLSEDDELMFVMLSPDRKSVLRYSNRDGGEAALLIENNLKDLSIKVHPLREFMRFERSTEINKDFVNRYFEWVNKDGRDVLVERTK